MEGNKGKNKGRRNELRELKYRRRLRNYRLKDNGEGSYYCYKTTGNPCSCAICQQPEQNYQRAKQKQQLHKIINSEIAYANTGEAQTS